MHSRQIIKIGNSQGVTIPADFLHRLGWKHGDTIKFEFVYKDRLSLEKTDPLPENDP